MSISVRIRRLGFKVAHLLLRLWWLIRRPAMYGVKFVVTRGADVVLVRHTYGRREWDLPGGGIKRKERPLDAARREMEEELGIQTDDWRYLGEAWATVYHRRDTLHCFQAVVDSPNLSIERAELADACWFPRDQLPTDLAKHVRRLLARVPPSNASADGAGPGGAAVARASNTAN